MKYDDYPRCPYCKIGINNWGKVLSYECVNEGMGIFFYEVPCPKCKVNFDIRVTRKFIFEVEPIEEDRT